MRPAVIPLAGVALLAATGAWAQPWVAPGPQAPAPTAEVAPSPSPVAVAAPVPVVGPDPAQSAYFLLSVGGVYQNLDGLHCAAGLADLGIGYQWRRVALLGEIQGVYGSTPQGRAIAGLRFGFSVLAVIDRWRVGGGLLVGDLSNRRVTRPSDWLSGMTFGLNVAASVDLVRWGGHRALFVGARGVLEMLWGIDFVPTPWAAVELGVRL